MKFLLIRPLMFLCLFCPVISHATDARVLAVKGDRAMVRLKNPSAVKKGDTVRLVGANDATGVSSSSGAVGRDYSLGLAGDFSSISRQRGDADPTKISSSALEVSLGFNTGTFEFGPQLGYSSTTVGDGDPITGFRIGGFADYNIIPNKPEEVHVFAARGTFDYLMQSSGGIDQSGTSLSVGPMYKGFLLSDALALTAAALYQMETITPESGDDTVTTGFVLKFGLLAYFN